MRAWRMTANCRASYRPEGVLLWPVRPPASRWLGRFAMVGPLRDGWAAPTAPSAGPTLAALGAAAHTTRAQSARASLPPRLQPGQQLIVAWRRRNPLDQPLHRGLRRHLRHPPPQRMHAVELVRPEALLLAARAARPNDDRRIDALLGEST